jgi:hypothetical protein
MFGLASKRVSATALRERSAAFHRVVVVQRYLHAPGDTARTAGAALAAGDDCWDDNFRCITSPAVLRALAKKAAWWADTDARLRCDATSAEAAAIRAVVRAYILRTSLARRTVARVLALGGWHAEVALLVLERVR